MVTVKNPLYFNLLKKLCGKIKGKVQISSHVQMWKSNLFLMKLHCERWETKSPVDANDA